REQQSVRPTSALLEQSGSLLFLLFGLDEEGLVQVQVLGRLSVRLGRLVAAGR
ncbi:hypothetical protein Pcinc_043499, partial [Petrolisthes cinctipes]